VEEASLTVCIAVRKAEIVGKMIQEQRERESKRTIEGEHSILDIIHSYLHPVHT
jgi:hypothetical protein